MNKLTICTLIAFISLCLACRKDKSADADTAPQPTTNPASIAFSWDTIGAGEMVEALFQDPFASISKGNARDSFTFELSCNNGLFYSDSSNYSGTGILDDSGRYTLYIPALTQYKDGELTLTVTFSDTLLQVKAIKQEKVVRTYKDFLFMNYPRGAKSAGHFVQTSDFAFPDTTFPASPGEVSLYGSYDGQGHTISNFKLSGTFDPLYRQSIGLFKNAYTGAVLKNLRLELAAAGINSTGRVSCGGLVGTGNGATIVNCSVTGIIKGSYEQNSFFGGIIGYSQLDTIIACSYRGAMEGASCGGIAGTAVLNTTINMCYAYWTAGAEIIGGIVGAGGKGDKVSNSYADMYDMEYSIGLYCVGKQIDSTGCTNVVANMGITTNGVTLLSTTAAINDYITSFTITEWPVAITNPPADNKPFVLNGVNDIPAKLWWE